VAVGVEGGACPRGEGRELEVVLQVGQGRAGAEAGAEGEVSRVETGEVFLKSAIKLPIKGGAGPKSSREARRHIKRVSAKGRGVDSGCDAPVGGGGP